MDTQKLERKLIKKVQRVLRNRFNVKPVEMQNNSSNQDTFDIDFKSNARGGDLLLSRSSTDESDSGENPSDIETELQTELPPTTTSENEEEILTILYEYFITPFEKILPEKFII